MWKHKMKQIVNGMGERSWKKDLEVTVCSHVAKLNMCAAQNVPTCAVYTLFGHLLKICDDEQAMSEGKSGSVKKGLTWTEVTALLSIIIVQCYVFKPEGICQWWRWWGRVSPAEDWTWGAPGSTSQRGWPSFWNWFLAASACRLAQHGTFSKEHKETIGQCYIQSPSMSDNSQSISTAPLIDKAKMCDMFRLTSSSRMYWYISLTYSAHSCGLSASELSMSSMCSCCARAAVTCPTSISSGSVNFRPWWVIATTFAGSFSATGPRSASTSGCCFTACDTCVLWGQQYVISFCRKAGRWVWKRYLGNGVCVVVVEGGEKWADTAHLSSCISFN